MNLGYKILLKVYYVINVINSSVVVFFSFFWAKFIIMNQIKFKRLFLVDYNIFKAYDAFITNYWYFVNMST